MSRDDDTGSTQSGFLTRWSQRKQAARAQDALVTDTAVDAEEGALQETPDDATRAAQDARASELARNQAAAEAVDLESLDYQSDYSVFLKEGVSTQLKNAALRKLWGSNPVLACVDGLNDYDHDFRTLGMIAEKLQTSWQVGKGYGWMTEQANVAEEVNDVPPVEAAGGSSDADVMQDHLHEERKDAPGDRETPAPGSQDPSHAADDTDIASAPQDRDQRQTAPMSPVNGTPETAPVPTRPSRRRVTFS